MSHKLDDRRSELWCSDQPTREALDRLCRWCKDAGLDHSKSGVLRRTVLDMDEALAEADPAYPRDIVGLVVPPTD